jgi:hypothetical protein
MTAAKAHICSHFLPSFVREFPNTWFIGEQASMMQIIHETLVLSVVVTVSAVRACGPVAA